MLPWCTHTHLPIPPTSVALSNEHAKALQGHITEITNWACSVQCPPKPLVTPAPTHEASPSISASTGNTTSYLEAQSFVSVRLKAPLTPITPTPLPLDTATMTVAYRLATNAVLAPTTLAPLANPNTLAPLATPLTRALMA